MPKYLLILGFLFYHCCTIQAQQPYFEKKKLKASYLIQDIHQDSTGFLWLAAKEGLFRYDGTMEERFEVYSNIAFSPVSAVFTQNGLLYVGSDSGRISIVDMKQRRLLNTIDLNSNSRVSGILKFSDQLLVCSTYGDGLFLQTSDEQFQVDASAGLTSDYIYAIQKFSDTSFVAATDRGLCILDSKLDILKTYTKLPDIINANICLDEKGVLWVSTYNDGVFSIHLQSDKVEYFPFAEKQKIYDMVYRNGQLVAATDKGVMMLNKDDRWDNIFNISQHPIRNLYLDHENNLWLLGRDKFIWRAKLNFKMWPSVLENIQCLKKSGDMMYIGTQQGLFVRNLISNSVETILPKANVTSIMTKNGHVWVGTFTEGIYVLSKGGHIIKHLSKQDGLADMSILDMEIANSDCVAVSTLSGAVYIVHNDDFSKVDIKPIHPKLGNNYVLDIFIDSKNHIWLANDKTGFNLIKDNTVLSFETVEGKKTGSIYSIAEASNGEIFLASEHLGILTYNGTELTKVRSTEKMSIPYMSVVPIPGEAILLISDRHLKWCELKGMNSLIYSEDIGLSEKMPYLNAYDSDYENDLVWFVHNDELHSYSYPIDMPKLFPGIKIDNIEVNLKDKGLTTASFRQSDNNFKFNYSGLWLTSPQRLSYFYTLSGYDEEWRFTKDQTATYPQLPPGSYTFSVTASVDGKLHKEQRMDSYSFTVRQAFYNTWWFYTIIFALVAAVLYILYKRDQTAKKLKAELRQKQIETQLISLKAQLNPHFLFNSFNTLTGLIEEKPESGLVFLENLADFYRRILRIGDQELISLKQELSLVDNYEKLLRQRFGDGFHLNKKITDTSVQIIPLSLQMLIENAVKHNSVSVSKPLQINILQHEHEIVVQNTLSPKNYKSDSTGLGLKNIIDRYQLLRFPAVRIEQTKKEFCVHLPTRKEQNQ